MVIWLIFYRSKTISPGTHKNNKKCRHHLTPSIWGSFCKCFKVVYRLRIEPLSPNPTKWSNALKQFVGKSLRFVCVFDHFVGLALKGLRNHTEKCKTKHFNVWCPIKGYPYLNKIAGWFKYVWTFSGQWGFERLKWVTRLKAAIRSVFRLVSEK